MNQDQLRAKSLALFHALVSNWSNDLRKEVTGLQEELLQKLDRIQERMSSYEERIDEERILTFANEAMSLVKGASGSGDTLKKLRASLAKIDHGTSLTEVLTILLEELSYFAPRVALFILKGGSCIGWNGRGFDSGPGFNNEAIKKISVPTNADTLFSAVINSRSAFVGESNRHRDNVQLLSRIGNVLPSAVFAAPLILRDKVTAVIYADSGDGPDRLKDSDALDILTIYAAKLLDALSAQKTVPRTGEHITPPTPVRPRESVVSHAATVAAASDDEEEGSGTVMFSAAEMNLSTYGQASQKPPSGQAVGPAAGKDRPRAVPSPSPAGNLEALDPETRKKHEEALRFAKLLVSEIKLYNDAKWKEGLQRKKLYELLRDDIDRSRQLYNERYRGPDLVQYFNQALVRELAQGDEGAMGHPLPSN